MNFTQDAPAIVISLTTPTPEAIWHQVLLGIEEEGILWQWQHDDDTDATQRAFTSRHPLPIIGGAGLLCRRSGAAFSSSPPPARYSGRRGRKTMSNYGGSATTPPG